MEPINISKIALCIFCYETTDDNDKPPDLGNDNYERFFSLIARHFLNRSGVISGEEQEWWIKNAWKVISELNCSSSSSGDLDSGKPLTRLIICDKCKVITEKWCELYDKVKELELLMDWEISKLGNVMRNADLDEETCRKGGKILEECSVSQELPLEDLRKSLKQSFQAYQDGRKKESFPRLSLSPVKTLSDLDDDPGQQCIVKMEDGGSDYFEDDGFDQNKGGIEDDSWGGDLEQTGSTNKNDMNATTTTVKRKRQVGQRKRKLVKVNQDHRCPPCGKIFKEGYLLRYHQSQSHPEVFFPESYSKISVQSIVKKMLDQHFTKLKRRPEEFTKGQGQFRYKCNFCSRILYNWTYGRSHLILRHRKNVEEKLGILSCDQDDNIKDKHLFKCDQCTEQLSGFKDKHKLFQHQYTRHLDNLFENGKMDNISEDKFKDYLRYLFKINVEDVWKRDSKGKCQFCEMICSGRRHAKGHLISKHFQILRDKLVGLQREFGEDGPPLPVPPKKKTIKKIIKQKRLKTSGEDNKCKSCSKAIKASYDLRYHQSQKHPEDLFLPEIFSKISVAYIVEKQVDEHFTKIRKSAKKSRSGGKNKGWSPYRFKCEICGNVLYARSAAKSHCVLVHLEIMREKLERLGESGRDLREIEKELEKIKRERYKGPKNMEKKKMKVEIVWKCEGEEGGCGRGFSSKIALKRHRELHCEVVGVKRGKRRGIREDLKVEMEEDEEGGSGESEEGEVVNEGFVKQEEFEIGGEGEGFMIFPEEMDVSGDQYEDL